MALGTGLEGPGPGAFPFGVFVARIRVEWAGGRAEPSMALGHPMRRKNQPEMNRDERR